MRRMYVLFYLFCFAGLQSYAQRGPGKEKLPLKVMILHETNQLTPGLNFFDQSFHPGIMVGTEWKLNDHQRRDWFIGANLGGFHHKKLSAGIFANGEIGYRYRFAFGLSAQAQLGLGYLHGFYPGEVYSYDDEAGAFQKTTNTGYSAIMPSVSVGLGYPLGSASYAPELQLMYMYAPEVPLNLAGLHQMIGIGIKFYPFNPKR